MRYLVGFVFVLAVAALPLSVSAQDAEGSAATEPSAEEPAPEQPVLELGLDDANVDFTPSPPRADDGYTLEEMELRVKRAKIGLWSTAGATVVGGVMIGASWTCMSGKTFEEACWGPFISGAVIGFSGGVGMIVTGALLGARKRKLRTLEAHYDRPRRVQWDLARSRMVF
jgi:F0F1-type ATP synthase assembly protein I